MIDNSENMKLARVWLAALESSDKYAYSNATPVRFSRRQTI